MFEPRLSSAIYIEAKIGEWNAAGHQAYLIKRGEKHDGVLYIKLYLDKDNVKIFTQERNLDSDLEWITPTETKSLSDKEAGLFLARAADFDPDLWVVEVEINNRDQWEKWFPEISLL